MNIISNINIDEMRFFFNIFFFAVNVIKRQEYKCNFFFFGKYTLMNTFVLIVVMLLLKILV